MVVVYHRGRSPHLPRSLTNKVDLTFCPCRPGLFSQVCEWTRLGSGPPVSNSIRFIGILTDGFGFVFFLAALLLASHGSFPLHLSPFSLATTFLRPTTALLMGRLFPGGFQLASMAWSWLAKRLSR